MIVRDALRSLRDDFVRSFFYWLTLLLTSIFIYLFFNMMMSDPDGASLLTAGTDPLATLISVTVIVICMTAILFANDFFVKRKAKELAVRLICGATALQLATYLLIQTVILLIIAIPVGLIIANMMIPMMNHLLASVLNSSLVIANSYEANLMVGIILGFVVFFVIMLNLSFALRNAATMMFSKDIMTASGSGIFYLGNVPGVLKKILCLVLWLAPITLFYTTESGMIVYALLSLVGLNMCIDTVFVPWLSARNEKNPSKLRAFVRDGFIRHDLRLLKLNLLLMLGCACLLSTSLVSKQTKPIELLMYTMSFIVMNVLLSLAVLFKYSTDLTGRTRYFMTLDQIGCTDEDSAAIRRGEVIGFYGFITLIGLLYLVNIIAVGHMNHDMSAGFTAVFLIGFAVPLVLCAFLSMYSYRRAVSTIHDPR